MKERAEYNCEATTIEGFVQQLAVKFVANGYWFYVTGIVPEEKDPRAVDRKLIRKYGVSVSKFTRCRRKRAGLANVQYLRHGRFFILIATHGRHDFFQEEKARIKDVRETPIKFASYAISHRGGHAHVRIERETYRDLKGFLLDHATRRPREWLERTFFELPFEPYAPVRRQLVTLWKRVNEARGVAQMEQLTMDCLRLRRRIVRPFDSERSLQGASTNRT